MDQFYKEAPDDVLKYAENISSLLCSIPLRFPILTDEIADGAYYEMEQKEFLWNRHQLNYRFVSQSLRYQRNLDYLGNYKTDWIIEVIQKYNLIAILVQMMREAICHYSSNSATDMKEQSSKAGPRSTSQ